MNKTPKTKDDFQKLASAVLNVVHQILMTTQAIKELVDCLDYYKHEPITRCDRLLTYTK